MRRVAPNTSRTLAVAVSAMLAVVALAVSAASAAPLNGAAHAVHGQSARPLQLITGTHFFTNNLSGGCLDQDYKSGVRHLDVLAYPCNFRANEQWGVNANANGSFTLVNVRSGGCLTQTGRAATVQPCSGSPFQAWWYVSVDNLSNYYFVNQAGHGCLDQDYHSGVQHLDVLAYPCNFAANEGWTEI
jgi:hypothetical protein